MVAFGGTICEWTRAIVGSGDNTVSSRDRNYRQMCVVIVVEERNDVEGMHLKDGSLKNRESLQESSRVVESLLIVERIRQRNMH